METRNALAPMLWLDQMPYGRLIRTFCKEGPSSPQMTSYLNSISHVSNRDGMLHHDIQRVAIVEMSRIDEKGEEKAGPDMVKNAIVSSDIAIFHMYGRQVVHLDEALAEELGQTDVDDVPPSEVRLPHTAFYLTFGGAAAVAAGLGDVQGLLVTSESGDPTYMNITAMRMEDGRAVAVDTGYLDLRVGETMAECLADAEEDVRLSDPTRDEPVDAHKRGNMIHEGFKLYNANQLAGMRRLRQAMRLLVNAILYMDSAGAGRRRGWHPDTPRDLAMRADGSTGAAKTEQRLAREGWTRITIMTLEDGATVQDAGTGAMRRTHWRRGHWRRQRHGAGNALIKRVRIRPVRVSGRAAGEVEGHEYVLSNRIDGGEKT